MTSTAYLYHSGVLRLRQVVIAARDLEAAVDRLCTDLKLRVLLQRSRCLRVRLAERVFTVGDQFIESSPPSDRTLPSVGCSIAGRPT